MSGPRKYSDDYHARSGRGKSIRQLISDELNKAVGVYLKDPSPQRRGIVRGLAIGLAILENPYDSDPAGVEKRATRDVRLNDGENYGV